MQIRGEKLLFFRVSHVIRNPQMDNLYTITFSTNTIVVPSFINGGRIEFWFPVLDNKGNVMFDPQLGHSYSTGDVMGCRVYYNGVYDIATKCRFMKSEITPNHAIVELVSFPVLVSSTVVLVYITKIKNPSYFNDPLPSSSEIMDANLKINIFNIDTTISSSPYYFDYFNIFEDLR